LVDHTVVVDETRVFLWDVATCLGDTYSSFLEGFVKTLSELIVVPSKGTDGLFVLAELGLPCLTFLPLIQTA
jgi:hypothetical protein